MSGESVVSDSRVSATIMHVRVILPTHPKDLETGDYFEVEIPELDITVANQRAEVRNCYQYIQKAVLTVPNLTVLCRAETFLSYFPLTVSVAMPVLVPGSAADPSLSCAMAVEMKVGELVLAASQEDYRLLLRLFDLNLGYDDCLDRLIVPGAVPTIPVDWKKCLDLQLRSERIAVLFKSNRPEIAEFILAGFVVCVTMHNDGFLCMSFSADSMEILRPKETEVVEAANPFQCSESEERLNRRLPAELLQPLNSLFDGQMLTFSMRKDRFGNKTVSADFRNLLFFIDFAFLQEITNFIIYGFPDYSIGEIDNLAYLHKCRPKAGQSFQSEFDSDWLSPLLDFEVTIKDSEFVLPRTTFTCKGSITYTFLKQNERDLKQRLGKQIHTSSTCYVEDFQMVSKDQRGETSRSTYATRVFEPLMGLYSCKQYQDVEHFPGEKVHGCEVNGAFSGLIMTLTISDLHQLWKSFLHQSSLIALRKPVIDSLANTLEFLRNPFDLVTQRQSVVTVSQDLESVTDSQVSFRASPQRSVAEVTCLSPPSNTFLYTVEKLDIMLIDDTNGLYKSLFWVKGPNEEYKGEEDPAVYSQTLLRASLLVHLYNPIADV